MLRLDAALAERLGQAVNIGLLGDGAGFGRRQIRPARAARQQSSFEPDLSKAQSRHSQSRRVTTPCDYRSKNRCVIG